MGKKKREHIVFDGMQTIRNSMEISNYNKNTKKKYTEELKNKYISRSEKNANNNGKRIEKRI